ncbi:MAG: hypothetical protein LBT43_00815 [Prevotella sp.]|jgi:hypothetical protein|nr:hypothetical protein [Prevotella sp.]
MKQVIYSFLLFFFPYSLNAQVSGIVIEKSYNTPIEGIVLQYGNSPQDYVISDKDGNFSIPEKHNSIIHIHGIGYKRLSILFSEILNNPTLELELSPIELNEIEISYIDANRLLEKAFSNTRQSLLLNQKLVYLTHFVQSSNDGKDKHELNLQYSALLSKNKLKNGKIPYELSLISLNHLQKDNGAEDKNIVSCEYHVSEILNPKRLENYRAMVSHSENDSLIILKTLPKSEKDNLYGSYLYIINKEDTTIHLIDINYKDQLLSKAKYIKNKNLKWAVRGKTGLIEFRKHNKKIYMYSVKYTAELHCIYYNGKEKDVIYYIDNKYQNTDKHSNLKQIKLNGYSQELFDMEYP